jgi:hypothetical protein
MRYVTVVDDADAVGSGAGCQTSTRPDWDSGIVLFLVVRLYFCEYYYVHNDMNNRV